MSTRNAKLGDIAEFINGAAFKPGDWGQDGSKIIRIQNLTDSSKPYNRTNRQVNERLYVQQGDLLVSWSATLAVFQWEDSEVGVLNQHIFRVVPDTKKVDKRYLRHALELALLDMRQHLHGATMLHVNRGEFLSTELYLPSLPEQRRIAAILDQADALRAKRREALAQLDSLTQAIFIEMFGGANEYPISSLAELCELITDGTHQTPEYADEGVIFLSAKNVTSGYVDWERIKFIPESLHLELHRRLSPRVNDILLAKNGTTGVAAIVDRDCTFDIYVSLALLRAKQGVLPAFLLGAINSPICKQQFNDSLKGVGVPNLHLKEIRATQIPHPPLSLQNEFLGRITTLEKLKVSQRNSLAELDNLFTALQHRAFQGDL